MKFQHLLSSNPDERKRLKIKRFEVSFPLYNFLTVPLGDSVVPHAART